MSTQVSQTTVYSLQQLQSGSMTFRELFFFPFSIFFSHLLNPCSFTYNILRQAVNSQPNKYLHLVQTCYLPFPWFPWIRILKNLFLCYLLRATPFTHFYLVSCQVVIFFFQGEELNFVCVQYRAQMQPCEVKDNRELGKHSRLVFVQQGQLYVLYAKQMALKK